MTKVLLCIPTLVNAGAERFVTELACNLNKNEFEVMVVTTGRLTTGTPFYQKLVNNGILVNDVSSSNYLKEYRKIRSIIKKWKPQIVHTNIGSALHMLLPVLWERKTTHIFTAHSMGHRIFTGVKKNLIKFAFKTRMIVPVGICDTVKKSICESYGLKEDMVACVYNGVDTGAFSPKADYCKDGKVNFISVGTLYELKNHQMLIDAFALVKKHGLIAQLTIVGGGKLFEDLNKHASDLGLQNDVIFTGNRSDINDLLSKADVYCSASKVEGLPISVLEAMSTGLPIITTPAGGVVDIVSDGNNGYIVPHEDVESMAEKMLMLAKDFGLIEKMGHKSREMSLKYDIMACSEGYENLYKSVLKKSKSR